MSKEYSRIIEELKQENEHVLKGCVISDQGEKIFLSDDWNLDPSELEEFLNVWKTHGPRITLEGVGFSVLRSEPEQLIARNLGGKGAILGSITKGGNYLFIKLANVSAEQMGKDYFDVARAAGKLH